MAESVDNKHDTATAASEHGSHQQVDRAVAQGGAYEVLRKRLGEQGARLRGVAETLNARRLQEFGDSRMEILGRLRIRTENNCVGRDIVQVGDQLLFGFNVFIGLKTQTRVEDVFGLYKLVETPGGYDVSPVEPAGSFLGQQAFVHDFNELYAYYKDARLLQLIVIDGRLLASFQIGERRTDVRVFRWAIGSDGAISYIDARGERDIALPPPFDFEWTRATREIAVNGRFPHLNIYDTLFVETTGGDLTIKVENNTESGAGIYSEPVDDKTQSLDDAVFDYARVGSLILLKILPYRETEWRGLIYNSLTGKVTRVDAIVQACVQLPEDHGIIFPGGYYLQNGEHKAFDAAMDGMQFKRAIRSPNGEDVLYVFYERASGLAALFVYNLIQRRLQNPLFAHGYARLVDGRMVLFHAEDNNPTRIHQMQVWQTPFTSDEFAANRPTGTSFLGRIGNAELVRAISNLYDLSRSIDSQEVSVQRYQSLTHDTRRLFDAHHWFDNDNCEGLDALLHEITATGESVLDEYEKVESIRRQSDAAMSSARSEHRMLMSRLLPENWSTIQAFVDALNAITRQRGHLLTIREYRYIDTAAIDTMTAGLQQAHDDIGSATGAFLGSDKALQPFQQRLQELDAQASAATTARRIAEHLDGMQAMSADLDMLSELMASLKVDDATERTRVVESISQIYARLNQVRARTEQQRKSLGSAETVAQFGAQFTLFGQAITSALGLATTPERADEQLSRLMVQLEELESRFGEHEQFLGDILDKREELLEAFETHKQALLDDRQRKAASVMDAANRILDGLGRRTERFATPDELNAFFAGDPLILKLRELAERLRGYRDSMKADDIEARIKATRDQAVRALRDRSELLEDGGNVIRLGPRHRFSVNTQPLDLTILPRGDGLAIHLTGTEYMEPVRSEALDHLRDYWQATLDSESAEVYRGEYLAGQVLSAALAGSDGLSLDLLERQRPDLDALSRTVGQFAAPRYRDGYEKGIHDHDATLILRALLPLRQQAGPLIHTPETRALALAWWSQQSEATTQHWIDRLTSAHAMRRLFASDLGLDDAREALAQAVTAFSQAHPLDLQYPDPRGAAKYLADEIVSGAPDFGISRYASELVVALDRHLQDGGLAATFQAAMSRLQDRLPARWSLARQWLQAMCAQPAHAGLAGFVHEAVALLLLGRQLPHQQRQVELMATVQGLLGEHPRIADGTLVLSIDETLSRLHRHDEQYLPGFRRYQSERHALIVREREALRLSEFKARPLTSFVRNRLINDLYLPVIGDNLAKQMGTVGDDKRSDLMGLLMMISPPGYGKTTLMEYVAHRLGLIFMKINGPALGHEVRSVDPAQAPDATSRQELEKLNLALEMGNNVMLYVDDIQHTHPEFLQKFISLCDGTRRIEGVWKGRTKTYDMRGRRFAVVMAGNPYTESGEVFKIPDMLANRADIYNLGDVLGGMEEVFTLSYIENCLTSNPVLAPLATRDLADLYLLVDKASGKDVSSNALSHAYSGAEVNEIVATLQRLMKVRDIVYKVNQQYIVSAAQDDRYRVEPPFRLQGSYRNMNKLAEKISPVMNDAELQQLLSDHYLGEAQLLTTGAEENLLKLAELRGVMDDRQRKRWTQIKADFLRNKAMGGDEADVGGRVVAQLADIAGGLQSIGDRRELREPAPAAPWSQLLDTLRQIAQAGQPIPFATPSVASPSASGDPVSAESAFAARSPALDVAIRPLLDSLQAQNGEQRTLAIALGQLAEAIREGAVLHPGATEAGGAAADKPRKRRKLTPEEIEFNRELERLRFSGKPAPGD